ncbi:hypothetical protein ACFSR7_23690 [Cohnella sp. GCM10020058]|uniref:hypothetical protein n=1 Tax=Cohnella sp. GCM10020058 TaxID=3317330 RepID=UPI0036322631
MKQVVYASALFAIILAGCSAETSAVSSSSASQTSAAASLASSTPPSPSPSPSEAAKPTEAPFDWVTAELTEENVRKALADGISIGSAFPVNDDTVRKIVANDWGKDSLIYVVVNPGFFLDEKDFVKRSGGSLIAYSKILFENPNVAEVSVQTRIDNVGGGENRAVDISWRRENIEGVDPDKALDDLMGDYTIAYQLARAYSIDKELYDALPDFGLPQRLDPAIK